MKAIRTSVILALALLLSLPALARNWYVSAAGTGDGLTAGSPTQDLAAVLSSAGANDALYLNGGDGFGYAPNILVVAVQLSMQSYGTGQAIISNTATAADAQLLRVAPGGSGSTLDNVQFLFNDLNTGFNNYRTLYLDNAASNITIRNCDFRHADSPGGYYQRNFFIAMYDSAHANLRIEGNLFRDLRYELGYAYRHHMLQVSGASDLLVANNIVSNYEGFLYFSGTRSARVAVLSNKLYRCYGTINWANFEGGTAGGLVKSEYNGLAVGEFAWNIIFNGFPDMLSETHYAAFMLDRRFNNVQIHNNTFYGLGAACLIISAADTISTLEWYNNILIACNANAQIGFFSVASGISSGMVYSNIWDPFLAFTNEFYGGANVYIDGNPLLDPQFLSLDPGSSAFLRPTAPAAVNGYAGGFIGAAMPIPEPLLCGFSLGVLALTRARRRWRAADSQRARLPSLRQRQMAG